VLATPPGKFHSSSYASDALLTKEKRTALKFFNNFFKENQG